jgi:AraC-like DNA-binding protein
MNNLNVNQGLASVPAVKQYLRAAEACGVDYAIYLEQANIKQETLNNNNEWVPSASLEKLLTLLIANCNDPCFGLHTSRYVTPDMYSVQGYITMNCATMREVWDQTPIYEKIVGDMGTSKAIYNDKISCLRWNCNYTNSEVKRQVTENVLASWHSYSRQFLLPNHLNIKPVRVCFTHSAPDDPALLSEYEEVFACEIMFNQEYNCICLESCFLELPFPRANQQLLNSLLEHASKMLFELDKSSTLTKQVKNLLLLMINKEIPRRETVAKQLYMSSRTLQRKLVEEGTSYQHVLDELRIELAYHYLIQTNFTLEMIAEKLGFTETRSFYRYFKSWAGKTAGEYRKDSRE